MSQQECKISVDNLYEWRKLLQKASLIPTQEIKTVIAQINDILEQMGVRHLEKRYFIITNEEGNAAGERGWIVYYNPVTGSITGSIQDGGMIEVIEEFSNHGVSASVPLSDLTEITKEQYDEIGYLISDGDDTTELMAAVLNGYQPNNKESVEEIEETEVEETLPTQANLAQFVEAKEELENKLNQLTKLNHVSNTQWIEILSIMIQDMAKGIKHQ